MIQLNESNGTIFETAQVRDEIKALLTEWLVSHEFRSADVDVSKSTVLFSCWRGEFVSVRLTEQVGPEQTRAFNAAKREAVSDYWRNTKKDNDTFWVHREWVDELADRYSV